MTAVAVDITDLRFRWHAEADDVLDITSLAVNRGEHLFIEGPSGCGKSTLLALIGGVITPNRGSVDVLGQSMSSLGARRRDQLRANHVGFVFQLFNLVPYLSTVQNVTLPCRFSKLRRQRARDSDGSEQAQAERLLGSLNLPLAELRDRPVTELSIGQQQRVAAARALMGSPEIIIADEPTSALDEGTRERFLELLMRECRQADTTLILVSHDPRLALLFDRQIALQTSNRAATADVLS
jgi:putative ABC transport system ATP-binding protein